MAPEWPGQPAGAYSSPSLNTGSPGQESWDHAGHGELVLVQCSALVNTFFTIHCHTYKVLIRTSLRSGPNLVYLLWLKPLPSLSSSRSPMGKGPHVCRQSQGEERDFLRREHWRRDALHGPCLSLFLVRVKCLSPCCCWLTCGLELNSFHKMRTTCCPGPGPPGHLGNRDWCHVLPLYTAAELGPT